MTERICTVEVCRLVHHAQGFCRGHYERWKRNGTPGDRAIGDFGNKPRAAMRRRWYGMIRRCENPAGTGYEKYGARGIKVCERWHDFELFLADMGYPPAPGMSLDRIDNDGDYEPGNVRWATPLEQRLNQRERTYRKPPAPCGTDRAYVRHLRRGEKPCDECRAAHAEAARLKPQTVHTCDHCGSPIKGAIGNLKRHVTRQHGEEVS